MDHPDLTVSNLMGNSIGTQRVKLIRNSFHSTLANSEDTDEMMHKAAFHQGLHCLPR